MNTETYWRFEDIPEKTQEEAPEEAENEEPMNLEEEAAQEGQNAAEGGEGEEKKEGEEGEEGDGEKSEQVPDPTKKLVLISKDDALKTQEEIPVIAYYYAASWCQHCVDFTKTLLEFYNEVNKEAKVFEVIQLSFDQSEN
jgi:thiol-disulfide isomerase/thioredoxin